MNIRAIITRDGSNIVKLLDIEKYSCGVLPAEMPLGWPFETLKAGAILARSLGFGRMLTCPYDYDVVDTTEDQAYDPAQIDDITNAAVKATEGLILYYKNEPVKYCTYSASNGGRTVSSLEHWGYFCPYLIEKDDPWTRRSGAAKSGCHGVGASQYGMYEMGKAEWTAERMLRFYFPGCAIGKLPFAKISKKLKGVDIYDLQNALNIFGYNLKADGKIGAMTTSAVFDFQKIYREYTKGVDGIVGANTWSALNTDFGAQIQPPSTEPGQDEQIYPSYPEPATEHFKLSEWERLGKVPVECYPILQTLMNALEIMREDLGCPIYIAHGYRPQEWQDKHYPNQNSMHCAPWCGAADIYIGNDPFFHRAGVAGKKLLDADIIGGMGIGDTCLHLDARGRKDINGNIIVYTDRDGKILTHDLWFYKNRKNGKQYTSFYEWLNNK